MRKPRNVPQHHVASQADRKTPNISGDARVDGAIMRSTNRSVPGKVAQYTARHYGPVTNYDGYDNYVGDD